MIDDVTLVAFVDGELDPTAMLRVQDAIGQDPEAQERIRLLRLSTGLVRAVYDGPAYQRVPPVAAALLAKVDRAPPAWYRYPAVRRVAAALFLIAAGIGGGMLTEEFSDWRNRDQSLADEIADYHLAYAAEDEHQVEVAANRRQHIESWLGERLRRKLTVPDLSARGFDFRGARLLVVDGRPVAQLLYAEPDRPHHPLGLCISAGEPGSSSIKTDNHEGLSLATWHQDGYAYVLIGWAQTAILSELAMQLRPQLAVS